MRERRIVTNSKTGNKSQDVNEPEVEPTEAITSKRIIKSNRSSAAGAAACTIYSFIKMHQNLSVQYSKGQSSNRYPHPSDLV